VVAGDAAVCEQQRTLVLLSWWVYQPFRGGLRRHAAGGTTERQATLGRVGAQATDTDALGLSVHVGDGGPTDDDASPLHVVADAAAVKRIFTLPYCDAPVSVTVHRVGETLFMDGEYDISGASAFLAQALVRRRVRVWHCAHSVGR
jgi:hypothetical protein